MNRFAFALSLLAAGLVSAQTAQTQTATPRMHGRGNPDEMFEQHLTRSLSLNASQQSTVHTLLAENREQAKPLRQQLQTLHTQMVTAVKNGDESTIESVTIQMSTLRQQDDALHAKAMSKIYATLTPEQKTKVGANLEMLMRPGFGPGFEGRRGGPPPQR